MNSKTYKAIPYIYLLLVTFCLLSIYSYTTSPFFSEMSAQDSAIFQIIGKGWEEGAVPYVALWDLKGPIIFFVNCLGYMISGSATGIFILQLLALFLTVSIIYNLLHKGFSIVVSCVVATLCGAISMAYGLAKPLMKWLLSGYSQAIRENVAMLVGMCLFVAFNYLSQRFWVFNKHEHDNHRD